MDSVAKTPEFKELQNSLQQLDANAELVYENGDIIFRYEIQRKDGISAGSTTFKPPESDAEVPVVLQTIRMRIEMHRQINK